MAGVNGIKAMFGINEVNDIFNEFQQDIEKKQLEMLQYVGEEFINRVRNLSTYEDQTGNLRSSKGYIILNNGSIYKNDFKGTDVGVKKGEEFANKVALQHPLGFILIGVAGMNYAAAVEAKGYDVITGSAEKCVKLLKEIIDEIKS